MKKDTFYFSHDSTAKDDPKCMMLIDQLGLEGYGIFWVLVETLRTQPDYKCPLNIIPSLARRYGTSKEKMEAVIKSFELFEIENEVVFFSNTLLRRMGHADQKRQHLSEAGKYGNEVRWGKKGENNENNRLLSGGDRKESKVKESKVKNTNTEDPFFTSFCLTHKLYGGIKKYNTTEFTNFKKNTIDWKTVLPSLLPSLQSQVDARKKISESGSFLPEWKSFSNWINGRCWEEAIPIPEVKVMAEKSQDKTPYF